MNNYKYFIVTRSLSYKYLIQVILVLAAISLNSCSITPLTYIHSINSHDTTDVLFKEKRLLLDTVTYFSNNYPYSTTQVERFYDHQFKLVEVAYGLNNSFKINQHTNNHDFIKDIDVRAKNKDSKLLIIDFKKPACFSHQEFEEKFPRYVLNPKGRLDTYSRVLDESKQRGTVSIRLELNREDKKRCVNSAKFDTYSLFSLEEYIDPIRHTVMLKDKS